jgi:hypothetical protein
MHEPDRVLARNIEQLMSRDGRRARRGRAHEPNRTVRVLVAEQDATGLSRARHRAIAG